MLAKKKRKRKEGELFSLLCLPTSYVGTWACPFCSCIAVVVVALVARHKTSVLLRFPLCVLALAGIEEAHSPKKTHVHNGTRSGLLKAEQKPFVVPGRTAKKEPLFKYCIIMTFPLLVWDLTYMDDNSII